jgi:DNA-binding MarR family transcriptional regulator
MKTITTTPELSIVSALYRTSNALVRELDQRLAQTKDVTFIQAVTLLAVDSFDRPQPTMVADSLSQQSQTITGVLDRLERAGLVRRQRDMGDRRAVRLELTRAGQDVVNSVKSSLSEHVSEVMAGVEGETARRLERDLQALEASAVASN